MNQMNFTNTSFFEAIRDRQLEATWQERGAFHWHHWQNCFFLLIPLGK